MDAKFIRARKWLEGRDLEREADEISVSLKRGREDEDGRCDRGTLQLVRASTHLTRDEQDLVRDIMTPG